MSRPHTPGGRRTPFPPSPLRDELVRVRLVEALAARFDVPVTALVAGAGFGKTTALAQAIRANEAAPRGIDAWISCEPGDEEAGRLSSAILSALGVISSGRSNLDRVLGALATAAPVDVCIVIDDLHELPLDSTGEQLVRELTKRLPPHAHLVLASRRPVPIPLARRRAAGQVVEVDGDALAFTDAEVAALAGLLGEDQTACAGLAGWPSLVRLVLSAPVGATRQFLWEEIVAGLSPAERSGLLALAVLGTGSASEVALVAGGEVDMDRLVAVVPLLHQDAHGTLGAHHLWEDAAERIYPAADVVDVRRRALRLLLERGDTVRMGSAAVRWGEADMFRIACVALVRESLGVLPTETAALWLASTPPDAVGTPEHRLLALALRYAQQVHHDDLESELDALAVSFVERGDGHAQAVTLGLGTVSAHARGDIARLLELTRRINALGGVTRQPELQFLLDAVAAAQASLAGDVEGTLRIIEGMSFDGVAPIVAEIIVRLHATMLVFSGRADEAVPIGQQLLESRHAYVRSIPTMLRWLAGDPSVYMNAPLPMEPLLDGNHLYHFVSVGHAAGVAASLGDRALADVVRPDIEATMRRPLDVRDSAIAATALACCKILDHDEAAAAAVIADHLVRHPIADARGEVRLRRNLAIAYMTSDAARQHWDASDLGPTHLRTRTLVRHLLAAREGRLDRHAELGPPSTIVTSLPLAWSVELAIRATSVGSAEGSQLLQTLAAWLPSSTRREIEWLAQHGDASCRTAAAALLEDVRELTHEPVIVDVLGAMRVRSGDAEVASPELRRSRVRTLLALLVLRGPLRRDRISDLLWPDLEPGAAAQNLRVTLSRLRRLLDPDRAGRSASLIRPQADSIGLAGPPLVDTDLWQFGRHIAAADDAQQSGDSTEEIACLSQAVELWRGDPLLDLASIIELDGEVDAVRRLLVDGCLRLGELLLVAGRFDESLQCAERSKVASPYSERAHRLAIACHLQRHDYAGLDSAVRSTRTLLAELGVEPEDATEMLVRRASVRLGTTSID